MNTSKKPKGSPWFAYLFLSLFLAIGLGCLLYAPVKLVKTALFIARSEAATGTVVSFHESRTSKSTTYAPVVTFTAPNGRTVEFRSQISSSSPDYSVGQSVPVYFTPSAPDTAEINAFVPLWMPVIILSALGLAFSAAGGGMLFATRRGIKEERLKDEALQRGLSGWQLEPEWRSNTISSVTRQEMWFYWFFAVVWNAIAQPTGYLCLSEMIEKQNRLAVIGLLFPLVGFWLLSRAIRKTLQMRKFGELLLTMDPFPGSIGGDVGGTLELPAPFQSGSVIEVTLRCLRATGKHQENTQEPVWHTSVQTVAAALSYRSWRRLLPKPPACAQQLHLMARRNRRRQAT